MDMFLKNDLKGGQSKDSTEDARLLNLPSKLSTTRLVKSHLSDISYNGSESDTNILPESKKFMALFKISNSKLAKIHTAEGKLDYIIDHMQNNIKEGLKNLEKNENERHNSVKLFKK